MGLTEDLHDLVDNPPPPRFDLDDLMRPGRARRRVPPALLGIAGLIHAFITPKTIAFAPPERETTRTDRELSKV